MYRLTTRITLQRPTLSARATNNQESGTAVGDWHRRQYFHRLVAICLMYYAVLILLSVSIHDIIVQRWDVASSLTADADPTFRSSAKQTTGTPDGRPDESTTLLPWFLALYCTWLLAWRVWHEARAYVFYEYCWLCNFTMVMSGLSMRQGRPWLALSYCAVVSVDQFLWYVDLSYYWVGVAWSTVTMPYGNRPSRNRFLVGVCQYVFDDQTSWKTRITCTHHLWTIPLVMWHLTNDEALSSQLRLVLSLRSESLFSAWRLVSALSFIWTVIHVEMSRRFIPLRDVETNKYLNVNLGHAVWKDVKLSWLQINTPKTGLYLFRLLWRWQLLNMLFSWLIVRYISHALGTASSRFLIL
jgi:hypothetical protein